MFVIPEPPDADRTSNATGKSNQNASGAADLELEIDLDLPEVSNTSANRKKPEAIFGNNLGGLPPNVNSVSPAIASGGVTYTSPEMSSPYRRGKSSESGPLVLTLGILAGVILLGGIVFGCVLLIQSYVASMPQVIAVQRFGDALTESEAVEASERWIRQANSSTFTPTSSESTFDAKQLYSLALDKVRLSPQVRSEAIAKMETVFDSVCALSSKSLGDIKVLKTTSDPVSPIVSMRMFEQSSGELAYVRVRCGRSEDLKVRVCDIDLLNGKGWASEQLKRHLISIPMAKQSVLDTFAPSGGYVEDAMVDRLTALCSLPATADASKRVEAFNELISVYSDHPSVARFYVMSCAEVGNVNSFRSAYSSFQSNHPLDPSLITFAMRYLPSQGVFDYLDKDIEQLEKLVGTDPYLDWYRALSSAVNNRFDEAKNMLQAISEQSWAPGPVKSLVEFANNPKGSRPSERLPLIGTLIATNKNLFIKPRTQSEIERELTSSYGDTQRAQDAQSQAMRNIMEAQEKSDAGIYSKGQALNAAADQSHQRSVEEAQRASNEYNKSQQAMQPQGPPPGYDPGGYGANYNPEAQQAPPPYQRRYPSNKK